MTETALPQVDVDETLRRASATIRDLRARLSALEAGATERGSEPLAVVGMACRLPGEVATPDEYWDLLTTRRDAVGRVEPWRWAGRLPAVGGGEYAGTIDDVDAFDPAFFGIGDAEATVMDPQQRIVLSIVWEAVERWGRLPATLVGSDTAVFLGAGHQDYLLALLAAGGPISGYVGPGNARSILANRVSYQFGLRGPSMVVDTACSSSLVAVHLATQSLRAGECSVAIAGGVNLILAPESTLVTGRALPLAPDGRTKTFDTSADGMVRGEGAGVVVLRRLSDALADGDHVHAVLRATGTNQDGRTNGLTAPSPVAQEHLLRAVLTRSGITAEQVTYIETHGTGTPLGDPIEFEALAQVYGDSDAAPTCLLGSVKPNLGHLEAAAGIASLLKAVLAVERKAVPGQVMLHEINPEIEIRGTRFDIPTETLDWTSDERFAAVSSFGFGGTNAHVIIGSLAKPTSQTTEAARHVLGPVVVPVTGHTPAALEHNVDRQTPMLTDERTALPVAAALARRRTHLEYRRAVVAPSTDALADAVRALPQAHGSRRSLPGRTAFVFGGQAALWSSSLLTDAAVIAEAARWDDECARAGEPGVTAILGRAAADPRALADTRVGQMCLAVIESAMVATLADLGLTPDLVLGHSLGELVAALVADRIGRDEAAALIRARSALQHDHAHEGAMVNFRATLPDVEHLLRQYGDPRLGVAAHNSTHAVVVAGPSEPMCELLARAGIPGRLLDTGYAFHSPALGGVAPTLDGLAAPGAARVGAPVWVSTVTGTVEPADPLPAERWSRNLAEPVRFRDAVTTALAAGVSRFIEIAPSSALASHITRTGEEEGAEVAVLTTPTGGGGVVTRLAEVLARVWELGATVDWSRLYPTSPVVPALPTSSFDTSRCWFGAQGTTPAAHRTQGSAEVRTEPDELQGWIRDLVAEVGGFSTPEEVDVDRPATELDVDSAEFVEVKNRLEDRLGIAIPITLLLDGASIAEVAARLARPAARPSDEDPGSAPAPSSDGVLGGRSIEELSEQELDRLLAQLDMRETP